MTIANIDNLPVIRVYMTGRSFTALKADIENQETKSKHTVDTGNISIGADNAYVDLTITDSNFQSRISSISTLSVNIYNASDSSPVYRDIVVFRTSLGSTGDYVQSDSDYGYIFVE